MKTNTHPVEPEELMAYLDGELPVERAAATAAHLQECRECQIVAAELKSVSESLTTWDIEPNEPQINAELTSALEERESHPTKAQSGGRWTWRGEGRVRRFAPWFGGALAGVVAALLLMFTMIFTWSRGEHEPTGSAAVTETRPRPSAPVDAPAPTSPVGIREGLASRDLSPLATSGPADLGQRQYTAQLSSNLETKRSTAPPSAPMILRTAQLTVITQNLDKARAGMDQIVKRYGGYVGDLTISAPSDGARKLTANLRVPAAQLDTAIAELKALGRVESESQSGQDVTAQYVDLEARLSNSRSTEQRLIDLLRQRTGKLSDVLEVETELSRVREEIERMEGERRLLSKQVQYATLNATISEEYRAPAQALPDSLGTRFRNAAVDGYQSVVNFVIGIALFLVADGPMMLLWIAILFFPARYAWRKFRGRELPPSSQ